MKRAAVLLTTILALAASTVAEAGDPRQAPGVPAKPRAADPSDARPPLRPPGWERERIQRERAYTLAREDIERVVFTDEKPIGDCYRRHAQNQRRATGDLTLHLIIHRDGSLFRFDLSAPGVRGDRLSRCLQRVGDGWRFPPRKGFTEASVPFRYIHTRLPGSGPYKSCWDRRGCRRKKTSPKK